MDSQPSGESYFTDDSLNIPPIGLSTNDMEVDSPAIPIVDSKVEESSLPKIIVPVITMESSSNTIAMERNLSSDSTIKVKKEDNEMIVDVMGFNGDESTPEDYQPLRVSLLRLYLFPCFIFDTQNIDALNITASTSSTSNNSTKTKEKTRKT